MTNPWVVLTKNYDGLPAGEKLRATSPQDKQRLLDSGSAVECADPEPDAMAEVVESATRRVVEAAVGAIDQRLAEFAAPASSSPLLAAACRDQRREQLNGFSCPGEFWFAVAQAGTPGKGADPRLLTKAPSGLHGGDGAEGGFLIPEAISRRIMELVFDESNLLARTDSEAIQSGSITLKGVAEQSRATGSRRGGVRGYWLAEAEQYTASRPTFREMTLRPHKLGVFYFATEEELADGAGFSLEQKLAQYAAEEINWLVSDAILTGDGVGKPLGILQSDSLVVVDKQEDQQDQTIVYDNIVDMYARMLPRSIGNAVWLANVDCMPQLMALTAAGAGIVPIFLNGGAFANLAAAPFGTLLGRPILITEHNPTLGEVGDLVFADLSMYKTVTRGNIRSALSIHVRFDYAETAFRFDFRVDGQPWLDAPIQPAHGSNTLSSFVAIEAR